MEKVQPLLQAQFDKMCATGKLFRANISGRELAEIYLKGFGNDPVFRDPNSSVHNCNMCKNFIHRYANIVAVDENLEIVTLFDIDVDEEYRNSFSLMADAIRKSGIGGVFVETYQMLSKALPYERPIDKNQERYKLGTEKNVKRYTKEEAEKFGVVKPNEIVKFHHMSVSVPRAFVDFSGESIESILADFKSDYEVFKRAMQEITVDTVVLVRDLINQGSLLNGDAHLHKIEGIKVKMEQYRDVPAEKRDLWCWVNSYKFKYAKFKNELIGVLCTELAEGKELNEACKAWNYRVDPVNYMKATAPITKRQIEEAKKFVEENGYSDSFQRRCATIDDIKASDILHINSGDGTVKKVSLFDSVKPTSTRHKRSEFDGVETVGIEKFMKDILPSCTSVEAFLQNNHEGNMVTLTTSKDKDSKHIFNWPNNYSWTYNGNLAGKSMIREEVKKAGGVVDAPFRFSIMWNEDGKDFVDLDAHCIEPDAHHIYYGVKGVKSSCGGTLDVDMIRPVQTGVENIYYNRFSDGKYEFFIQNYDGRNHKQCKAEIFIDGEIYTYLVPRMIKFKENVGIASVYIKKGKLDHIEHSEYLCDGNSVSKEIYGLETNQFHKVNLVCLSPNHWESSVGNKHYFFMLEGCKSPTQIRGFHNENLISELREHRKVMEVLANTTMVESTDGQLSGLGFNATVRDELVVRLKGSHNRVLRIQF